MERVHHSRNSISHLEQFYNHHKNITMVTAFDFTSAKLIDGAGLDAILVGDSLGECVLGFESTMPLTVDMMLHHCRAVIRGCKTPLVVAEMPFGSYQIDRTEAVRNAVRFVQEGGVQAVKVDGGLAMADSVAAIVNAGVPVMGQIGGNKEASLQQLIEDAKAMQEAGCFAILLSMVPEHKAGELTDILSVPTIGYCSGSHCNGQLADWHDILGLTETSDNNFHQTYANLSSTIQDALQDYCNDVETGSFPSNVASGDFELTLPGGLGKPSVVPTPPTPAPAPALATPTPAPTNTTQPQAHEMTAAPTTTATATATVTARAPVTQPATQPVRPSVLAGTVSSLSTAPAARSVFASTVTPTAAPPAGASGGGMTAAQMKAMLEK